jgi:AcrR family transcriptional regulator
VTDIKSELAPSRRRRLDPAVRREQLLDSLLVLVTEGGFGSVSMEAIARAGGIAKTVVYKLFGDVDGALNALFAREQDRTLAAVVAAIPLPPFANEPSALMLAALRNILADVQARPDSWRLLLVPTPGTPPGVRASIEAHRDRLVTLLRPAVAWILAHYDAQHLDDELLAHTVIATVEHGVRLVLEHPNDFSVDRIVGSAAAAIDAIGGRLADGR